MYRQCHSLSMIKVNFSSTFLLTNDGTIVTNSSKTVHVFLYVESEL